MEPLPRVAAGLAAFLSTSLAAAATYYVGPTGAGQECTRAAPCALPTGAAVAVAGDTVVLLDGTYYESLNPENSGTPDAWITFQADECALPIIEGPGEVVRENDEQVFPSGVFSNTGTYLRFIGIASRYWDSGFTNGWTGVGTTNSNGNIEYINCIGDGNGRTGFAMYSAGGVTVRECLSAHNGGSPTDSWSSGIQLYAVQGTAEDNVLERNVSFENTDAQKNSDGSGFIVDEDTRGATFINNVAFRNGGSCIRLTRSDNTRMIHFSCYHNGMNPNATGPTNPGEFYFTDSQSRSTAIVVNTLAAASGTTADPNVFMFPPETGLSNNVTVDSGATPFFSDPEGMNPDFRPPSAAASLVENQGTANGAPNLDIGFDPKCIVRRDPNVPYQQSWWSYAVDYDYIRSIGGVAKCFHPKQRTGGADVGAYELSGEPHAWSTAGSCVPSLAEEPDPVEPVESDIDNVMDISGDPDPDTMPVDPGATAGTTNLAGASAGDAAGAPGAGSAGAATPPDVSAAGAVASAGAPGAPADAGAPAGGNAVADVVSAGSATTVGNAAGASGTPAAGSGAADASDPAAGAVATTQPSSVTPPSDDGGCALTPSLGRRGAPAGLTLVGLLVLAARRRRRGVG